MKNETVIIKPAIAANSKDLLGLIKGSMPDDDEFVKRYYEQYFSQYDEKATKKDMVYAAFINTKLVGSIGYCCDYFSTEYSYWIGWFVVNEQFRKKGIGTKLLENIETDLKAMNKKKLFVSTEDDNNVAKIFYIRNGFKTEGVLHDYYGRGENQLILSKVLSK